jgi:hypothetical protein
VYRPLQFHERIQLFIGTDNETLSVAMHVYQVRPRKDHRGVDLISDALPFRRLWYGEPNAVSNAVDYAKFYSRSSNAVAYDDARQATNTNRLSCSSNQTTS